MVKEVNFEVSEPQDTTDHTVEVDNPTGALTTAEAEVQATVEVPRKTITIETPSKTITNRRSPRCNRHSPTPYKYKVSHFSLFQDHSPTDEGQLYTDKAPDGHRAFSHNITVNYQTRTKTTQGQGRPWSRCQHHPIK